MNRTSLSPNCALPAAGSPRWRAQTIAFFDLETTGVGSTDRLVSFGGVKLKLTPPGEITVLHLVFNPECAGARAAGYTASELARQDRFDDYAQPLRQWIAGADLLIANSDLQLRFLRDAFARARLPDLEAPSECVTRRRRPDGVTPAAWEAMTAGVGRGGRRDALRGAWTCMQTFLRRQGLPWRLDFALCGDPTPANYRPPESRLARLRAAIRV